MGDRTLPIGAWEGERSQLENIVLGDRGDTVGLPEVLQFRLHVTRMVLARQRNTGAEYDHPAAFVLVTPDKYQELKLGKNYTEERLIHTGARRLTGRVHYMTVGATSSLVQEAPGDAALFSALEVATAAGRPTFVYVPQHPTSSLSYYPDGCSVDTYVDVPLCISQVTVGEVLDSITALYEQELVTPDGMGPLKIWQNSSKGWPSSTAEKAVQQLVRVGLITRFSPLSIRQEQSGKVGRTDIEIVEVRREPENASIYHALLELKVLRSYSENGAVVAPAFVQEHITDGVNQAFAYGSDKAAKEKMLCCFDMRTEDVGDASTFAHVAETASTLKVSMSRWFLYSSSEAYREALAASRSGVKS